jgi:hypothetical protein
MKSHGRMGPWERLNVNLPHPLDGATAHCIDHILYIVCGQTKVPRYGFVGRNAVWSLDLRNWNWTQLSPPKHSKTDDTENSFAPRVWHSSTVLPAPLPQSWKILLGHSDDSVLDQAAIIITAGRSTNLHYYSDCWVFLTRTHDWFVLPGASDEFRVPPARAAHASAIVNVDPIGRCMILFGGRYRRAPAWEDSDDEDDFDYNDHQSDDEPLDYVDRPDAPQRKESHQHFNEVWLYPLDTPATEHSWTELNVISPEIPRRRSCLSVFNSPHATDQAIIFGGYTCSNMRYRYFNDCWILTVHSNGRDCFWKRAEYRLSDPATGSGPRISRAPPPLSIHSVSPAHKDGWVFLFGAIEFSSLTQGLVSHFRRLLVFAVGGEGLLKSGKDNTHYLSTTWAFKIPDGFTSKSQCSPFRRHLHDFISSSTEISSLILPTLPEISLLLPTTLLSARAKLISSRTVGLKSATTEIAPYITQWLCYGHLGPSYDIEQVDDVLAPELLIDLVDLSYSFSSGSSLRLRVLESMHPLILGFSNKESAGALKSLGLYLSADFDATMKKLEAIAAVHNDSAFMELLRSEDVDAVIKRGKQHTCDDDIQNTFAQSWIPRRTDLNNPFSLQVAAQRNLYKDHSWVVDAGWLSSRCPFFESLLRSGLSESAARRYEVQIDSALSVTESCWVMETLLQYLHSNQIPATATGRGVSPSAVDALASVAHYWGLITDHQMDEDDHPELTRFVSEHQS